MVARKRAKKIEDKPCARCAAPQSEHPVFEGFMVSEATSGESYDPVFTFLAWLADNELHEYRFPDGALDDFTETEYRVWHQRRARVARGDYDVPLPPPEERRRIRERAEWTQQDVGDELEVSRHMVGRWEKVAVGYRGSERLPGREPSGKNRADYAELLNDLQQFTK